MESKLRRNRNVPHLPHRQRRYGDVRAESGGDGSDQEEGRRDPPQAVRRDLGALRRNSVPQESHREQAGSPHTCHRHAPESAQVKPEKQDEHTTFVWPTHTHTSM